MLKDFFIQVHAQTWVKDFADRRGRVAVVFQVLGQSGEVARDVSPVAVKVVEAQSVGTSARQQGISARGAKSLLRIWSLH